MMYAVVHLSSKLGQVTGKGLFHVIKDHYARWLLWPILIGVLIGNTIEAGADLGGMAAAIRNVFRWAALALLATSARRYSHSRIPWRC
jgi:Mn2+/Fe2+ NRAMP family transporter